MSLTTRQEKGSKLTIQEMDNNLSYLEQLAKGEEDLNFVIEQLDAMCEAMPKIEILSVEKIENPQ